MADHHGDFIWYELMSPDTDGARSFYEPLVGWHIDAAPQGDMDYRMIATPDGNVGGLMKLTPEMISAGAQPIWVGYICVSDVDATAAAMIADGATKFMQVAIPDIGTIAMMGGPNGGVFYIMKPTPPADNPDAVSTVFDTQKTGHCSWNELVSNDHKADMAFFNKHFGWEMPDAMDMGPMGEYRFIEHKGQQIGAMMTRSADMPPPMWNHYWRVPSIADARAKAETSGAIILMEPHEVPGGDWILVGKDPQGAAFHLVGPDK